MKLKLPTLNKYIKYPLLGGALFFIYVMLYLIIESFIKHTFTVLDVIKISPAIFGFCQVLAYFMSYIFLTPFIKQYNKLNITETKARAYITLIALIVGLIIAFVNASFTHEIIKSFILFFSVLTILYINFNYYIALDKRDEDKKLNQSDNQNKII